MIYLYLSIEFFRTYRTKTFYFWHNFISFRNGVIVIITFIICLYSADCTATQIVTPVIFNNGDTVTAAKLNGNQNAITNIVNGSLDNTNMTSGYKLFQAVASLPSPGNQGNIAFLTSNNTLNLDNGSSWQATITPNGSLATGQFPYYNNGWQLLNPGAQYYSLVSNGISSLPSYQQVDLTQGVTNVLPIANGGTGSSTNPIPSGIIAMWSGTIATIPTGWELCNGSNGTPDLRNRFIVGAVADSAGVASTTVTDPVSPTYTQSGNGQLPATTAPTGHYFQGSGAGTVFIAQNGSTGTSNPLQATFGTGSLNVATYYALAYIEKI